MVKRYGSRSEVFDDLAEKTRGGLTKTDLILSKGGKIVSKRKSEMARASYKKFGFNKRVVEEEEEPAKETQKTRKRKKRRKKE